MTNSFICCSFNVEQLKSLQTMYGIYLYEIVYFSEMITASINRMLSVMKVNWIEIYNDYIIIPLLRITSILVHTFKIAIPIIQRD